MDDRDKISYDRFFTQLLDNLSNVHKLVIFKNSIIVVPEPLHLFSLSKWGKGRLSIETRANKRKIETSNSR